MQGVAHQLSPEVQAQIQSIGGADIMVGIPSYRSATTIPYVVRAATAGLVQYFPDLKPVLVNADGDPSDETRALALRTRSPDYVEKIVLVRPSHRLQRVALAYQGVSGKGSAIRTIMEIARQLKVKALVLVDSDLRSIGPEWIELLAGPILKGGYDFVAPLYIRHKYDGTITNVFAYPLTRALYGKRIRQPIGGDFGLSDDLVEACLASPLWDDDVAMFGIDIWLTTLALNEGFAVCQAVLGAKVHDAKDPGAHLGPMFRQVVATTFRLAGHYRAGWEGIRGSRPIPLYGFERLVETPPVAVDQQRLLQAFQQGTLTWRRLWEKALSREVLGEVLEVAEGGKAFAPELWARAVYDVLWAFNRSGLEKGDLLESFTTLYFGRVASLVEETAHMSDEEAESVVEAQAQCLEALKPYLEERFQS
jgi:glycosyltransferase involved in cell wall biosynthesis